MLNTVLGCCLIHLSIGSVYSLSVLYPTITQATGWSNSVLINGFALTILALGITASQHQKAFQGKRQKQVLMYGAGLWFLSQFLMVSMFLFISPYIPLYYVISILAGIAIGLLYVIPINIVTNLGYGDPVIANGLVVWCFGIGSIVAAQLYALVDFPQLITLYGLYFMIIMLAITRLIYPNDIIESPDYFKRDKHWYQLAVIFFINIGIGISLLSNLSNLSMEHELSYATAVYLVALAGLANAGGRLVYSIGSRYIGKLNMITAMSILQLIAIIALNEFWSISVLVIISVYGGLFAIMPSFLKECYGNTIAYSQILAMWGVAGLICPIAFSELGYPMLLVMSIVLVVLIRMTEQ